MANTYYKNEEFLKRFGENLKRLRKAKGLSQEELANRLGFSQSHVGKIESGITNTSISHAAALAQALDVPTIALFDF